MMPEIFVFTAGDRAARQHLADSIEHPIPDGTVFANFGERHHEELERISEEGNGFYAWGALPGVKNRRTWEAMEREDRVLCVYDNAYRYTARVLAKYDNPDLAKSVWGEGEGGNTWRYMYFLTQPRKTDRYVSEFADHLNVAYFGFTKISDEKLDAIATSYGSVEEFVDRIIDQHTEDDNVSALRTVLSWIRNLRTQVSPDGRFHYKPLLLLALLDVLHTTPQHPNSFRYEELLRAFEKLVEVRGSTATEAQFSQP
jgi:hypothetical protein